VRYAAALAESVARSQASGSFKRTAMFPDLSEYAVLSERANRCVSEDMSVPLSDKLDGTTPNVLVNNSCLPAGQRANKRAHFYFRC
jgi:hypothetical protein